MTFSYHESCEQFAVVFPGRLMFVELTSFATNSYPLTGRRLEKGPESWQRPGQGGLEFKMQNWKQSFCRRGVCRHDFVEMSQGKDELSGDLPKYLEWLRSISKSTPPFPEPKKCIFEAFYIKIFIKKNQALILHFFRVQSVAVPIMVCS